jgi:hypothetical protein
MEATTSVVPEMQMWPPTAHMASGVPQGASAACSGVTPADLTDSTARLPDACVAACCSCSDTRWPLLASRCAVAPCSCGTTTQAGMQGMPMSHRTGRPRKPPLRENSCSVSCDCWATSSCQWTPVAELGRTPESA